MCMPTKQAFGAHPLSARSRPFLRLVVVLGTCGAIHLLSSSLGGYGFPFRTQSKETTPRVGLFLQPESTTNNETTTSPVEPENWWQGSNTNATPWVEDPHTQLERSTANPSASRQYRLGDSRNVSVYLVGGNQLGSLFLSHTVDRFGSGKMNYSILSLPSQKAFNNYLASEDLKPPCIIVRRGLGKVGGENSTSVCVNMVSGDESCTTRGPEKEHIRHYYGKERNGNHTPYLPLGPYVSAWKAIEAEGGNGGGILLSSQRKFVFNAIFSENTSPSRKWLSRILSNSTRLQAMPSSIRISAEWTNKIQKSQTHMQPSEYAKVLLNSIFTLAPIGNNPESFRIYEAIESGSIPVIAKDAKYNRRRCRDALAPMKDAPFVYLSDWGQLEDRLRNLMNDLPALEERQKGLQTWYSNFMTSKVAQLERLLEPDHQP